MYQNVVTIEMLLALKDGDIPVEKAVSDADGNPIISTYASKNELHEYVDSAVSDKATTAYVERELAKKQPLGDYATPAQVDEKISAAIEAVTDGAPAAFDTFKEIADYISSDKTGTAELLSRVSEAEKQIETLTAKKTVIPAESVTIPVSKWSGNRATVTVNGITASSDILMIPDPASASVAVNCSIKAVSVSLNAVTFSCASLPGVAVTVSIVILKE